MNVQIGKLVDFRSLFIPQIKQKGFTLENKYTLLLKPHTFPHMFICYYIHFITGYCSNKPNKRIKHSDVGVVRLKNIRITPESEYPVTQAPCRTTQKQISDQWKNLRNILMLCNFDKSFLKQLEPIKMKHYIRW